VVSSFVITNDRSGSRRHPRGRAEPPGTRPGARPNDREGRRSRVWWAWVSLCAPPARLQELLPLARAHDVPLDDLVAAPQTGDPRIHLRPGTRHGMTFVPLTRRAGGIQAFKVVYPPAARWGAPSPRTHEGYEWFYVMNKHVRFLLGNQDLRLGPGEAAEFRHPGATLDRQGHREACRAAHPHRSPRRTSAPHRVRPQAGRDSRTPHRHDEVTNELTQEPRPAVQRKSPCERPVSPPAASLNTRARRPWPGMLAAAAGNRRRRDGEPPPAGSRRPDARQVARFLQRCVADTSTAIVSDSHSREPIDYRHTTCHQAHLTR